MDKPNKILVADDDENSRYLLRTMLESLGYGCELARNGSEALDKLKEGFDLVLLDAVMPDMDGFETTRQIRASPNFGDIPIVMVTVLTEKQDRLRAVDVGANDFISKPVEMLELQVRVRSLLKMKEAQDEIKRHREELETTVQKRTAALAESEKRFRTLFETAQDCVFVKDRDLRYREVNAAAVEFCGVPGTAMIGKTDRELFGDSWADRSEKVEARVIQGQTIKSQETVKYKSLSVTWDILRFPMRDASGEISGICGIAREVADRPASFQVSELLAAAPQSAAMNATLAAARLVAETNSILLLTGESGTGKDHLARYIHVHSRRSGGPFRVLNCAAVPADLAESELFGHEARAFTGASRLKRGQTELAEGGTLLLNEVGELPRSLQAKLLTFLDTLSFTRVGGEKPVVVNARLIAATNKDLSAEVAEGRFREDLFYRLNVFTIHLPPLRERIEDIPTLVGDLIGELAVDMQLAPVPEFEPGALAKLSRYTWPGNIRELRNVLERALILSQGSSIGVNHLVLGRTEQRHEAPSAVTPGGEQPYDILADMERSFIEDALQRARGKKEEAARLLGISRYALARHMKKYRITGR